MMAFPGGAELLLVLAILVLLFGAPRIPRAARAMGESIGEFRRGRAESEVVDNDDTRQ